MEVSSNEARAAKPSHAENPLNAAHLAGVSLPSCCRMIRAPEHLRRINTIPSADRFRACSGPFHRTLVISSPIDPSWQRSYRER